MTLDVGPWVFVLNYPRPLPGLSLNDHSTHWRTRAKNTKTIRQEVFWKVRAAHVPALDRVRVDVAWVVPNRRVRDVDNLAGLLKVIYDGVGSNRGISARIVDDDSPEFMEKPTATIEPTPGATAHFRITLTALEGLNS